MFIGRRSRSKSGQVDIQQGVLVTEDEGLTRNTVDFVSIRRFEKGSYLGVRIWVSGFLLDLLVLQGFEGDPAAPDREGSSEFY